jgi:hypothetical protein
MTQPDSRYQICGRWGSLTDAVPPPEPLITGSEMDNGVYKKGSTGNFFTPPPLISTGKISKVGDDTGRGNRAATCRP